MSERDIVHEIRLALGADARVVLWRNSTGHTTEYTAETERHIRYGLCKGSSDLVGIVVMRERVVDSSGKTIGLMPGTGLGRFFALEVKTPVGRLTPEQTKFLALVNRMGGFAACVRSVEAARAALDRAAAGAVA